MTQSNAEQSQIGSWTMSNRNCENAKKKIVNIKNCEQWQIQFWEGILRGSDVSLQNADWTKLIQR